MRRLTGLAFALSPLTVSLLSVSFGARAQQVTRSEVGVGLYQQSDTVNLGTPSAAKFYLTGPFARCTLNLNRSLAFEASVSDSLNMTYPERERQGGHEVLVLGGIKAGVRRRYFGVYGRLDAGAASYSRGDESFTPAATYYRDTHFALQPGVALEAYLTKRTIVRFDVEEDLNAVFGRHIVLGPNLAELVTGAVPHHAGTALSLEHRFGSFHEVPDHEVPDHGGPDFAARPERVSVGALFPLQIRQHLLEINSPALGGGGAWVGFPLYRFLSTDLVAFDIPHDDRTASQQDGGTSFSAFAGPKLGFHLGRVGLFVKARPGITRFSRTVVAESLSRNGIFIEDRPKIDFTLDTGGVIEYTPSRHTVLRFEAGDAFIHYHGSTITSSVETGGLFTTTVFHYAPVHNASILFLGGVGWHF